MNLFGTYRMPFPPAPPEYEPSVRYTEVPPEAPRPRMWKLLTRTPEQGGVNVEVHYAMARWPGGDLDVDMEAALRDETSMLVDELRQRNAYVPPEGSTFQRTARKAPTELTIRVVVTAGPVAGPFSGWSKN